MDDREIDQRFKRLEQMIYDTQKMMIDEEYIPEYQEKKQEGEKEEEEDGE